MLLQCPKCQHVIDKVSDSIKEGETIERLCEKCGKTVSFFIKYKANARVLDSATR